MTKLICRKCGAEFTEKDKTEGNYRESRTTGSLMHLRCPGKDYYVVEQQKKQAAELSRDHSEPTGANPSAWIVKRH